MKFECVLLACAGLAPAAFADVRVVSPTGPFTDIQIAVTAANDGDTVLVKSGSYAGFRIENKSLTVVADNGASVHVSGSVVVRVLAVTKTVVVSGLDVLGVDTIDYYTPPGLILQQNVGSVRLQDCTFHGVYGTNDPCFPRAGAEVVENDDVAFTHCTMIGADSSVFLGIGGTGLDAISSNIALYDCTIAGGRGGTDLTCSGGLGDGYPGGAGTNFNSPGTIASILFASDCSFKGGDGGDAVAGFGESYFYGGDGSTGMRVQGPTNAHLLGCTLQSGIGGDIPPGTNGQVGVSVPVVILQAGATIDDLQGRMRELHATAVVRAGQPIQLEAHGAPGDIVGLRLSQATRFEYEPQFNGVGLTAQVPTGRLVRLGTIPTSGRLSVQLPSVLAVGTLSQTFHLQSLHRNPQGMFTLGSLRELVIVDPAY